MTRTLAETLSTFAAGPLTPDETMARFVRLSLSDWMSVGIAGRDEPVARAARMLAAGEGGTGSTLFGGGSGSPRTAALVNGAASHALDYDDTHFGHIGHPSVAIMPAALAVGEARGIDGPGLLGALTVGLETACRVGRWLGRSHYDAGFHQTGTSGAFGAAAAAGRVMGLDARATTHALCLTATRAAGLKSQFGTMGKPLNAGFAAEVGVTSALLAEAGVTSAPGALEGAQGFGPTHAGSSSGDALEGLGETWLFPDISYKFHACCHGLHAMLEALRLLPEVGSDPDAVETVAVHTHPRWLAVCNQPQPMDGLAAKFSYRLTAAMSLAGIDTAALDSYSTETCTRPDVVALRDRVTVVPDAGLSDTEARVAVTVGGRTHQASHDLLAPVTAQVLARRLDAKAEALIGAATAADLRQAVAALDGAPSLSRLTRIIGIA